MVLGRKSCKDKGKLVSFLIFDIVESLQDCFEIWQLRMLIILGVILFQVFKNLRKIWGFMMILERIIQLRNEVRGVQFGISCVVNNIILVFKDVVVFQILVLLCVCWDGIEGG